MKGDHHAELSGCGYASANPVLSLVEQYRDFSGIHGRHGFSGSQMVLLVWLVGPSGLYGVYRF